MFTNTSPPTISHQYTSIYSAVSDILFNLLLIFSQGIVNKRSIFISKQTSLK